MHLVEQLRVGKGWYDDIKRILFALFLAGFEAFTLFILFQCTHIRNEVFYRMGFGDQEIVALLCGGHVYGRCHPNFSGEECCVSAASFNSDKSIADP